MENQETNMKRLNSLFSDELKRLGYDGVLGVASLAEVHQELMPVQKKKLVELCGGDSSRLIKTGSIISIGMAYPEHAIDSINVVVDGVIDKDRWNVYAEEYRRINKHLDTIARKIADVFGGIPVAATIGGLAGKVQYVQAYYPLTISHRVVAENAGLGWRGKNELLVNDKYGCAMRFASVVTEVPLPHGKKEDSKCGTCGACLDACTFLKNKDKLADYRENCRRFIDSLGLADEVCGKCIAACYRQSIFKNRFQLRRS